MVIKNDFLIIIEVVINCFKYVWLKNVMSQLIKLKLYHHFWRISDEFLLKMPKIAEMGT